MGEDDFLTFQELGKIRKKAKNNDSLQELDESFLKDLRDYLDRKKRLSGKLDNKEYRNAKRIAEDIIDLRELKILKRAALAAKSNIRVENLLKEEEPLFEKVKNSIVLHREIIQNTIEGEIDSLEDSDTEDKDEVEGEKKVSKNKSGREENVNGEKARVKKKKSKNGSEEAGKNLKEKEEEEKEDAGGGEKLEEDENTTDIPESKGETKNLEGNGKKEKEAKSKNREDKKEREKDTEESKESEKSQEGGESYKKVKITSDLSEFLGTDMKSYGPLEKGEKVKLPEENARVLLDRGKAEKIKIKE